MAARAVVGSLLLSLIVLGQPATAEIGLNFTGHLKDAADFLAPWTAGAVGPSHIVELVDGHYTVYDKLTGQPLASQSDAMFWATTTGILQTDPSVPRMVYDKASQRWFATGWDWNSDFSETEFLNLGVSNDSNPLSGWKGFKMPADPYLTPHRSTGFPKLGIDADTVYVNTLMLNRDGEPAGQPRDFVVHLFPKADLLQAAPTIANQGLLLLPEGQFPISPFASELAVDYGPSDGRMPLFFSSTSINGLQRWDIVGGAMPQSAQLVDVTDPAVAPIVHASGASQPGTPFRLGNVQGLLRANLVEQGDSIWATHSTQVGGRIALRWYEIDENTSAVRQSGEIGDPGLDLIFPSIAVNEFGDVVIGFTATGPNKFPSAYAVVGDTAGGVTTFGSLLELKAGSASYRGISDGVNQWGLSSSTVVDPSDPLHFWTFQEFAITSSQWGVQITEIIVVPEPSTLVLVVLAMAVGSLILATNVSRHRSRLVYFAQTTRSPRQSG
jgi:hypothetical protein